MRYGSTGYSHLIRRVAAMHFKREYELGMEKCVINGVVNRMVPYNWAGFEAAHIFPLEKEDLGLRAMDYRHGRHKRSLEDQLLSE